MIFNYVTSEMKSIFFIILFYLLGEALSLLIGGFLPGSVLGMLLLFAALSVKVVKSEAVDTACKFLIDNMLLFFVPVGVGIVVSFGIIAQNLLPIILSVSISTIIVMGVTGFVAQKMEKK